MTTTPDADHRLGYHTIDVVERHARRLGLEISMLSRPEVTEDHGSITLTAATAAAWIAWRDALEDESTEICKDAFGKMSERWAHGYLCGIPVVVMDPSIVELGGAAR